MANIKQTVKLGVFTLAIMNVTAVVSLRGLPAEAVYGMSSAFYYLFAAIVFLIPTSLVAAELAAMFQDKQGGAVTVLSLLFVVMPSVQSFYQILSQLTVVLYLIMYMLMFSGAIVLRYKMKKLNRPFRIGKNGNGLMWLIGGLGFCGSLLAFVLSFIPPSQISTGSNTVWFSVLIIGALIVVIAPFIIYASKKPSWVDPNSSFEPFHWEEQPAVQTAGKSATNMATGSATASSNGTSNSATSGNTAKDTTNIPKG